MATTEQRNNLIDKLYAIKSKELLSTVDKLIEVSVKEDFVYKITEQKRLSLQESENDIANNNLISDEELNKAEDESLKG